MNEIKNKLKCLDNINKEDDYNLAIHMWQEMQDNELTNTWDYDELTILINQYCIGNDAAYCLHNFIVSRGANSIKK